MMGIIQLAVTVFPPWFGILLLVLFAVAVVVILFRVVAAVIEAIPFL